MLHKTYQKYLSFPPKCLLLLLQLSVFKHPIYSALLPIDGSPRNKFYKPNFLSENAKQERDLGHGYMQNN